MIGELLHEEPKHWTERVRSVQGYFVSDCRSLVDHVAKTGASVSEKRVGLDIADLRAGVENDGDVGYWMPTEKMPADVLTKHMTDLEALRKLLMSNRFNIRYERIPKNRKKENG